MEDVVWIWSALGAGIAALILAYYYAGQVMSAPQGSDRMKEISAAISEGANAFLRREYTWVAAFVAVLTILIFVLLDWGWWAGGVAYIFGAALSALAGFVGMRVATAANARTTEAARTGGVEKALPLAFRGGAVMGFTVAGLGLAGFAAAYLFFVEWLDVEQSIDVIAAVGLGASSIALFARVGGGIYTKAADVGADLVGKVEAGIPEDDPRNPATIADNVGDNVGDVAGMGADIFESYVGSVIATIVIGVTMPASVLMAGPTEVAARLSAVSLPILYIMVGFLASVVGVLSIRVLERMNPATALWQGGIGWRSCHLPPT